MSFLEDNRNKVVTSGIVVFVAIGLLLILILPPSSERTIIIDLANGSSNATGVLSLQNGTNGLWLNQTTGNILINNTMYAFNLGSEQEIIFNAGFVEAGNPILVKGLLSGDGIIMQDFGTDIMINATSGSCDNLGSVGEGICIEGTNTDLKKLLAGTGIILSSNATRITITNTSPESTACNNVGTGVALCSGGNMNLDSLIAGTGITITDTTDDYTIASTVIGDKIVAQVLSYVREQITKTNLPVAYTDIYTATFSVENLSGGGTSGAPLSFTNVTEFKVVWQTDFVGGGTDTYRWVDVDNNANVLFENSGDSGNCDTCGSAWTDIPSWITALSGTKDVRIEMQGKSSNGTNDPIVYGYVIYVK